MRKTKAIASLIIQLISIGATYLFLRNWSQFSSIKIGVSFTLIILLLGDALPWISIRKTDFTFNPKWHHSRFGVFSMILALIYEVFTELLYNHWKVIRTIQFHLEEKVLTIFFINIQFYYFCLGVALTLVLTQVHEIVYFGTFKFPDRGFPFDIRLKLG